jgi:preprotein translocase subunit SecF
MAAGTLLGLAHDVIIPIGLFAVLGEFAGVQIGAVYVAAVLTILGYTVSDKVVIYDRVRENLLRGSKESLPDLVHHSVMQTLVRSVNNTLVVMLSSLAVFLFGGESIRYFALALMVGIGLGAYSSIFVAAPLLVWFGRVRGGKN